MTRISDASSARPAKRHADEARPPLALAAQSAACLLALLAGWTLAGPSFSTAAYVAAYIAGGAASFGRALAALWQGKLTVDLLMIVAAAGAATIGDWAEGGVLLFLFSLSNTLEAYATYRTRHSIESLVQLRPSEATLVRDADEVRVVVESLKIGDVVRIRPGERIAVDGDVIDGETWIDEATITGESEPVRKTIGSKIFAGTMNGSGSFLARVRHAAADSTLERIVRIVQDARAQKNPTQQFVEAGNNRTCWACS